MTIHKYTSEYANPTGENPNVPEVHDYDRTKPNQPKPVEKHTCVFYSATKYVCIEHGESGQTRANAAAKPWRAYTPQEKDEALSIARKFGLVK